MRTLLLLIFTYISFSAIGQEYKPFKVNISLGYAKPIQSGISGGVSLSLEPKYGLTNAIDLGLRLEGALMARGIVVNGDNSIGEVGYTGSYLVTGNYLFGKANARPFLGLGGGLYNVTSSGTITITDGQSWEDITLVGDTKWGAMLRGGIKAGHFLVSLEYNFVGASIVNLSDSSVKSRNDYLGIKLGFDIGGGRL
ncbi:hypothetical protein GXP67_31765 [Rhodocytophaga rosea]|uniref:Outer membrane beta-barrel protein n=1 Tax=Rhodocytophaga rosea TaxID=2704465 RepID=A0A6C0GU52_9BACT|nr:hypothetical protein [Rhodocytophaga rosea]QHT70900.1 hypothetical protein GXP67_31765 [Rhodocytophaga rosea]